MSDIKVLHPDHPKVYARWTVIIGANFVAYSPIVQRSYGLGVAKTLLRGWRHRQDCVLCWTLVYSLIRMTWGVEFVHKLTLTEKCIIGGGKSP